MIFIVARLLQESIKQGFLPKGALSLGVQRGEGKIKQLRANYNTFSTQ